MSYRLVSLDTLYNPHTVEGPKFSLLDLENQDALIIRTLRLTPGVHITSVDIILPIV